MDKLKVLSIAAAGVGLVAGIVGNVIDKKQQDGKIAEEVAKQLAAITAQKTE